MTAAAASKRLPVKRCNDASDTAVLIVNHLPFPRVRSAQQQNTIISNTTHMRNFSIYPAAPGQMHRQDRPRQNW